MWDVYNGLGKRMGAEGSAEAAEPCSICKWPAAKPDSFAIGTAVKG